MTLILIDNYDSFTYNIVQAYQQLGAQLQVIRNDSMSASHIRSLHPEGIILGPGPGNPKTAGISKECVLLEIPLFGICLGHQVIAEVFGATIKRARQAMHGKISSIFYKETALFFGLPQGFNAVRYHSLIIEPDSLPHCMEVIAWTEEGEIMAIQHKELPIFGVQFHPESVASERGDQIIKNSLYILKSVPK